MIGAIDKDVFLGVFTQENAEAAAQSLKPYADKVFGTIVKSAQEQGKELEALATPQSLPELFGGKNPTKGLNLLVAPSALDAYLKIGGKVSKSLIKGIKKQFDKSLSIALDIKPSIITKLNNIKIPPVKVDLNLPKDPVAVKHTIEQKTIKIIKTESNANSIEEKFKEQKVKSKEDIEKMVEGNQTTKEVLDDILREISNSKQTMVQVKLDTNTLFEAIAKHSHYDGRTIVVKASG
jgi:hypothetical protein